MLAPWLSLVDCRIVVVSQTWECTETKLNCLIIMALLKLHDCTLVYYMLYQYERSPLLAACEGGHTETAQLLIDKGADVNNAGEVSAVNTLVHIFVTKLEI